jgi:adenylylsulfate reductase subunit A
VAGGCPQKYVTGALAEGEIAAQAVAKYLEGAKSPEAAAEQREEKLAEYEAYLNNEPSLLTIEQLEETMQKVMDQYAGGISTDYQYNESGLKLADEKIRFLKQNLTRLAAKDMDDLLRIYEIRERLIVCQVVIAHLMARKETRWHSFAENMDHPQKRDDWMKYVNSRMVDGRIQIIYRELVTGGAVYEHSNS